MLTHNSSEGILLNGKRLTRNEATQYLKRLKKEYEKNNENLGFTMDGQVYDTKYAYYVIEYLEMKLKPKKK